MPQSFLLRPPRGSVGCPSAAGGGGRIAAHSSTQSWVTGLPWGAGAPARGPRPRFQIPFTAVLLGGAARARWGPSSRRVSEPRPLWADFPSFRIQQTQMCEVGPFLLRGDREGQATRVSERGH